ncbi:J domain-containing protein [Bacillus sp. 1NLA3E]|uniref:J domain-containing protein n=1 Tax=Bacillus sp. 1NLA3E TaxID=666686 RepID=UPI000247F0DA|nr:J domain-containing protein [Bacillus sp. 1NLA3E]AGK53634.1 heat shock protein DnaJ domain-containing protein [Bacillus sp. 1NLA3E]
MELFVNYYDVLGIRQSATSEEIKKAYRKRAKETHPDKKNGNDDLFKLVKESYEVLFDEESRRKYNLLLEEYIKTHCVMKADSADQKFNIHTRQSNDRNQQSKGNLIRNLVIVLSSIAALCIITFGIYRYQSNVKESEELKKQISAIQKSDKQTSKKNTSETSIEDTIHDNSQAPVQDTTNDTVSNTTKYKENADPAFIAFYEDTRVDYEELINEFNNAEKIDFKETQNLIDAAEKLRVIVSKDILNGQFEFARQAMLDYLDNLISGLNTNIPQYEIIQYVQDIELNYRDILSVTIKQ